MFKAIGLGWVLVGLSAVGAAQGPVGAGEEYRTNPKFVAAVKDAREMERAKRPELVAADYKKANKIAGGRCVECLAGLYRAQMAGGSYKDAMGTAQAMEGLATTPMVKSVAAYDRGRAMMARDGDKPKPEQLEEARAAFEESINLYPQNMAARFNEGQVLERLGRTEEARKAFELCLASVKPTDQAWLRVKHFAENPELAMHKMAPAFEVTALDGSKFNLDAMGGRVVLIDFWATWCGPCNAELPHLQKIAKEFAGQPLVMISVSSDKDEAVWKEFVEKHGMTWVQYRDADHKLADEFGVTSIPHYFTIDSDGVLTSEMMGSGSDVEGKLKKLIARAGEGKVAAGSGGVPKGN